MTASSVSYGSTTLVLSSALLLLLLPLAIHPACLRKALRTLFVHTERTVFPFCTSNVCLDPRSSEAQEPADRTARSRLQLALHAQRDPLRDEMREVGRRLSLEDTLTGRYGRLYSRRRLCARRGAHARLLLRILLETCATSGDFGQS
jgi:hypothetical protein